MAQTKAETPTESRLNEQKSALKKLDFLTGTWRGNGWVMTGANKRDAFTIEETAQFKLDGLIWQVEGLGKAKDAATNEEKTVHNALGLISYDPVQKIYQWKTYTFQGYGIETTAEIGDKRFVWKMQNPQVGGTVRFTITLTETGNWLEIGEMTPDEGKTWFKFFEMQLQKIK